MTKILIVDDYVPDVYLSKEIIEEIGANISVDSAGNGVEALDKMNIDIPNIMLLDINMPKMNGLELLKQIKVDDKEKYKDMYVIMLTTSDRDIDILTSSKLNADAYMIKPIDPDEFKRKLNTIKTVYIDNDFEFVNLQYKTTK